MKNFLVLILLLLGSLLSAQKTESPFLQIDNKDAVIPLKSSITEAIITGNIALVTHKQTYQNKSKTPIEARYVFPMSLNAAVHDMKMKIGNRTLTGKVYEKTKANKIYKKALKEGKRASKLAQSRPNIFQMNVGNIMPNDEVIIVISYTELINLKNGEYEFVLPGVVGPRFTGESGNNESFFKSEYSPKGTAKQFHYDLKVSIQSGLIISKVKSSSHEINIHYPDANTAEIELAETKNSANKDFILNYSLRDEKIQAGLMLYQGEKENFFSFMIEPPHSLDKSDIPPREYLFIVDVSGSMMGHPIKVAKSLMQNLLGNLRSEDMFNVLLFSAENKVFRSSSVIANQENIKSAFQFLNGTFNNYGSGTRLLKALNKAYSMPRSFKNNSRTMVVITDGYVSVEKEAFDLISQNLDKANLVSFGIGSSVNRYLIEGMARVGQSASFIASNKAEAYKIADQFRNYISTPLLTQIKFETEEFEVYDVEPKSIPDVFSERPITIFGKFKGNAEGSINVSGFLGKNQVSKTFLVKNGRLSRANKALKYLWARKRIQRLWDYSRVFGKNKELKEEIIALGIDYNLATKYTFFVAVDNEVVNKGGNNNKINQVLPLPKNVENSAVGAGAEIKGQSIYHKPFSIHIKDCSDRTILRNINLWLNGNYSNEIVKWLSKAKQIRIVIDKSGKVLSVKHLKNGVWSGLNEPNSIILRLPNHIKLSETITIHIK